MKRRGTTIEAELTCSLPFHAPFYIFADSLKASPRRPCRAPGERAPEKVCLRVHPPGKDTQKCVAPPLENKDPWHKRESPIKEKQGSQGLEGLRGKSRRGGQILV